MTTCQFSMLYHIEQWAQGTKMQFIPTDGIERGTPYVYKEGLYHYFVLQPDNMFHLVMTSSRDLQDE